MRVSKFIVISAGLFLLALPVYAAAGPKRTSSRLHSQTTVKHPSVKRGKKTHAPVRHESAAVLMPAERATEIQMALIKKGYLTGEPTGVWDSQTVSAMEKLQADSGWQSKVTPDSRALIKLGLGPDAPASVNDLSKSSTISQAQP
jgi:peptidoglycan hydrolase-like protein with peptidoglycan-binding domain